jgi:hypothetical protein
MATQEEPDLIPAGGTAYRLDLTASQMKITHTALRALRGDLGHDEHDVRVIVDEVLDKLQDEHVMRAIDITRGR